jgi:hypothetical protein
MFGKKMRITWSEKSFEGKSPDVLGAEKGFPGFRG